MQASHTLSSQSENLTVQKEILEMLLAKLNVLQAQNLNLSETVQQLSNGRGKLVMEFRGFLFALKNFLYEHSVL